MKYRISTVELHSCYQYYIQTSGIIPFTWRVSFGPFDAWNDAFKYIMQLKKLEYDSEQKLKFYRSNRKNIKHSVSY